MPFVSEKQRKAMYAAAKGKSNIGIPKKVAKKFISHSKDDTKEAPSLLALPPEKKELSYDQGKKGHSHHLGPIRDVLTEIAALLRGYQAGEKEPASKDDDDDLEVPRFEGDNQKETFSNRVAALLQEWKTDAEQQNITYRHGEQTGITGMEAPPEEQKPVAKDAGPEGRAAGIMLVTTRGETLMIRRGYGGDFPGTWAVPGGHQNPEDKDLEEAARREMKEETGIEYDGPLEVLYDNGQFCTYIAKNVQKQDVKLNYESTGYDWCDLETPPFPLHPGQEIAVEVALANTEYDKANLIRREILPSPQMFANVALLAIRITGTGLAYRSALEEHVWRDPSLYLNQDFLNRCNGLIVIMDHPESAVLNSKEFKDRAIGSVILPYIKGDEVWGIAKIYDEDAIKEILEGDISTSPAVVFDNSAQNTTLTTEDGSPLLIEGVPFLLDHIAIVTKERGSKGVWDKGGDPAGVLINNLEVSGNDRKSE
jgi:8-oxo-dGTP pyrophosphatase MutT (NUDIX family)